MAGAIPMAGGCSKAVPTLPCRVPWPWALPPLLLLPQPRTTIVLQKMRSKQIMTLNPPRKPKLTSFPHPKEAPCWTGQDRTGQTAKPLGGGKVSKREGGEKPSPHAVQRGERAGRPGLCDGNAGGGQGQMPMDSSPKMQPPPALSTRLFLEGC